MKKIWTLLTLGLVVVAVNTAQAGEKRPYMELYEIVSDTYEEDLARGVCMIEGKVIDQSGVPVQSATVARVDNSRRVTTDRNGFYQLKLTHRDSVIYMFHPKYGEIVIRPYDFKGKHRVVINFYPIGKGENQTVKKPVIYCYGEKGDEFELRVTHPAITFAYPELNENWRVRIQDDGMLHELNTDKVVPYLFWEGNSIGLEPVVEADGRIPGFVLESDTLVRFFETTLHRLGLNARECTDFITFWVPELQTHTYVFIQFWIDKEADRIADLHVIPQPESLRRVYMIYQGFESLPTFTSKVIPQSFDNFTRKSTTVVEWGGCEVLTPFQVN